MTSPIPVNVFSSELLPDERIEWTGRPNTKVMFHPDDWLMIPFSLIWGGFAIFWLLGASGIWDISSHHLNRTFEYFGVIWGTPFVLVGQYMIWGRFVYAKWKKARTYYALTNRRALIIEDGLKGRASSSAYYENLVLIDKRTRSDGIGSISFGGPVAGEWRLGKNNPPRPPTFDDIDDANAVYKTAMRLCDAARRSPQQSSSRWSN